MSEPDLSRHLLRAQEEERKRISRELHDETGQGLMLLRMHLESLASDDSKAGPRYQEAFQLLDHTIEGLRRIIRRLSPRVLDELGLLPAIRKEAREISRISGIKAKLHLPAAIDDMDPEAEIAIYRTVQEALHNMTKHSGAKNFCIKVAFGKNEISVAIEDDGIGFSKRKTAGGQGFGLTGMRDRVAALGGNLRIRSVRDKGTRISISLPRHLIQPGCNQLNDDVDCIEQLGAA